MSKFWIGWSERFAPSLSVHRRAETWAGWVMVLPACIGFSLFSALPTLRALQISFTDWNLLRPSHFVGWDNYAELLGDGKFWNGMGVSLIYVLLNIPLQLVLGLGLALAMDRLTRALCVKALVLLPISCPTFWWPWSGFGCSTRAWGWSTMPWSVLGWKGKASSAILPRPCSPWLR